MPKKILQVVQSAYRATVEEQDDTIVWLTHAMKGAGADVSVLLRGNAVCYLVRGQDPNGLRFGARTLSHKTDLVGDVEKLIGKGVVVSVVAEDLAERGIADAECIAGAKRIARADLPALFAAHAQILHW